MVVEVDDVVVVYIVGLKFVLGVDWYWIVVEEKMMENIWLMDFCSVEIRWYGLM